MQPRTVGGSVLAGTSMVAVGVSVPVFGVLTAYPVLGAQAVRYGLAVVLLAVIVAVLRLPWPRIDRREFVLLFTLAGLGLSGFSVLTVAALKHTGPANVGVIVGCVPIVLALVGPLLEKRSPLRRVVVAAIVVSAGAAVVQGLGGRASALGLVLAVGALACEAAFSLLAVPLLPRLGPTVLSTWVCGLATVQLGVLAWIVDGSGALAAPDGGEVAAIAYLAVVLTVLAMVAWYTGVDWLGVDRAGLFGGLVPVSAVLGSMLIDVRAPGAAEVVGAIVVGLGVVYGLTARQEEPSIAARSV